jgi:hypothetical protein
MSTKNSALDPNKRQSWYESFSKDPIQEQGWCEP